MEVKFIILITLTAATLTLATEPTTSITTLDPSCTRPGVSCLDCWTSLNCINLGNGTFYPEKQHCPIGKTCKESTGSCETDGNYECYNNLNKFECHTAGTFPSPFNCNDYHVCVQGPNSSMIKYDVQCPPSYEFDSVKKICRSKTEKSCKSLVPVCHNDTQIGAFPNNSNIFYTCKLDKVDIGFNYIPQLHGCPFDFFFNGTQCENPNVLDNNGWCLYKGVFAHLTNCIQYYDCSYVGESPIVRTCSNQYQMFDRLEKKCVYFSCSSYNT